MRVFLDWLWVVLCAVSIWALVPVARSIEQFVSSHFGKNAFVYLVYFVLAVMFFLMLYVLVFRLKVRSAFNYFWLVVVAFLYVYCISKFQRAPAEAVHFLEYGLLGILLFRALSHHVKDKSIYFTAALIALWAGIVDEFIQWVTPMRLWEFRDVGLNALSGSLALIGLWMVVKPGWVSGWFTPRSRRIFSSVLAVCLIVLGLCASNTPERVASYTSLIPGLSFLNQEEPMSEFGYKHLDPEIGIFYSRLSLGDMEKTDREKGREYGELLSAYSRIDYQDFLKRFNTTANPFLHEVRVHLSWRDTYWEKGEQASEEREKGGGYFAAYKENLILKKYFGQTVGNSVYKWEEEREEEIKEAIEAAIERLVDRNVGGIKDKRESREKKAGNIKERVKDREGRAKDLEGRVDDIDRKVKDLNGKVKDRMIQIWGPYESPVSSELFTAFTLKQMWLAIGIILLVLVVWGWFFRK